jgi:hypothetical protein
MCWLNVERGVVGSCRRDLAPPFVAGPGRRDSISKIDCHLVHPALDFHGLTLHSLLNRVLGQKL